MAYWIIKRDAMEKEYRKLSELKGWDKNPKTADEAAIKRLKEQIILLGMYKPLMITPDGTVIGGNQRLKALQELHGEIDASDVWVFVVDPKTEEEKIALALSDNEQAGAYDERKLYLMLNRDTDVPLDIFGIDLGYALNIPSNTDTSVDLNTVKEKEQRYLNNEEKQIVLYFYEQEYMKVSVALKEAQEDMGVPNPEQVIIALLARANA